MTKGHFFRPYALLSIRLFTLLINALILTPSSSMASSQSSHARANRLCSPNLTSGYSSLCQQTKALNALIQKVAQNAEVISLDKAIRLMEAHNPNLAYYRNSIDSQYWSLIAARRLWYPSVFVINGSTPTFSLSSQTSSSQFIPRGSSQTFNSSGFSTYAVVAPGIALQWAFLNPTRDSQINTNASLLDNQQFLYIIALRNQLLSVQSNYFQVQAAWDLVKAYTDIYSINLEQLDIVEERFKKRLVDLGSLGQTKAQLYIILTQLISYYNQYLTSVANLSQSIGLKDSKLFIPDVGLKSMGSWNMDEPRSIQSALENREEIKAYLAQAAAARWQSQSFLRSYLPILSLYGSSYYNNNYNGFKNDLSKYSSTYQNSAVGINLSWNIFDGGVNLANAASSRSQSLALADQAAIERLAVTQQVRSSFSLYQTASQALIASTNGMRSADTAQKVARARFQYGVGNITTVVQALQLYGQASQQNIQALLDYNTSLVNLYRYSAIQPLIAPRD